MTFDLAVLGKDETFIDAHSMEKPVHRDIVESIRGLKSAASARGFDLTLASGFRNFDRQCSIWNRKVNGELPVLDSEGEPLVIKKLDPESLMFSILKWSALPGASRHHWGTDFDIFDGSKTAKDYCLQLTVEETLCGGPFAEMYKWLNAYMLEPECEFYRPYKKDLGGVAVEPWHLSHKKISRQFEDFLSQEKLTLLIKNSDILLKKEILDNMDQIFSRYIINTSSR